MPIVINFNNKNNTVLLKNLKVSLNVFSILFWTWFNSKCFVNGFDFPLKELQDFSLLLLYLNLV